MSADEDAEQRLRERLKQRQSDRRKTKEEACSSNTSVEVSIKASNSNDIHPIVTTSDDKNKDAQKHSISNSASMIENSTGGNTNGSSNVAKEGGSSSDRKRSRSPAEGDERKSNENGGSGGDGDGPRRARRRRKRGGRRRRPRREERPGDMHRGDNRGGEFWGNQQHGYPPHNGRDGPYYYDQHPPRGPPGGPPGYYDRYPYDYHDHRYPPRGDRYERDEYYRGGGAGGGGPPLPERERDFRRYDRDERMKPSSARDPRDNTRGRSRSRSVSDKSYDSRSASSSRSRSRSFSRSNSRERAREEENGSSSRSPSSSRGKRSTRHRSSSRSRSSSRERASSNKSEKDDKSAGDAALTKDQRTVFVSQLVMRADEHDIRRYFKKKAKCRVNDVIFLKDRRTGRHKGSAYVELAKLEDVPNAVKLSGQVPDFQRFPISIKGSDAEKNYEPDAAAPPLNHVAIYDATNPTTTATTKPSSATNGHHSSTNATNNATTVPKHNKKFEIQNVYIGSIDRCVTQAQLFALFSQFGSLEKVSLQVDTTTGLSRGFAFLSFRDVKDANLAIQTMSGQQLAGRALKTGWANQPAPGIEAVTSDEFPEDSAEKIQNAHKVLTQLTGSGLMAMASLGLATGVTITPSAVDGAQASSAIESTAEAAINAALGVPTTDNTITSPTSISSDDPKIVKGTPSCIILVHNMFDKDEETDEGWQDDIKEEFVEESSNYGAISKNTNTGEPCVLVVHDKPGGMVYAQFETIDMAKSCAEALTGRWFDKRQLRVEYVSEFPL